MEIRWLHIAGIGPFASEHTVDFSAFEDLGLFLLGGPTGTGKSTLIGVITLALYGDVAHTKNTSKDRLWSDHISDSDPPETNSVLKVGTDIYRVTRIPACVPTGKESQRNPEPMLVRVVEDPDAPDKWCTIEPTASDPRDVGSEIPTIIGLDKDQLLQTIMFPQGKLSQFLDTTSDTHGRILCNIFNTQVYVGFTKALVDMTTSSKRGIEERRVTTIGTFGRVRSPDAALTENGTEGGFAADGHAAGTKRVDQLDTGVEDSSTVTRWAEGICERVHGAHTQTLRIVEVTAATTRGVSHTLSEGRTPAEA